MLGNASHRHLRSETHFGEFGSGVIVPLPKGEVINGRLPGSVVMVLLPNCSTRIVPPPGSGVIVPVPIRGWWLGSEDVGTRTLLDPKFRCSYWGAW